jgi:hypothetical protein
MFHARDVSSALHMTAVWSLVVAVLFGPAGLGGSAALASSKTCGASCPCDEAVHGDNDGTHEQHVEDDPCDDLCDDDRAHAGHADGEPCEDECPDDCSNCGCCLGIAMAVLSKPVTSSATSCASARMLSPVDAPANGARTGIFRPPRSLT